MKAIIKPSKLNGKVMAPPSKSMAHRLLICAGLSGGISIIKNIAESEDILATMDCLKALGCEIELLDGKDDNASEIISSGGKTFKVKGVDLKNFNQDVESQLVLNARESGSTLRFFIPVLMTLSCEATIKGSERLLERPLSVYEDIAKEQGIIFEKQSDLVKVKGSLKAGNYKVPGNISSQFITGLLFALSLLEDDSEIEIIPPVESKPYIDMTIKGMSEFGVNAVWDGEYKLKIKGGQKYTSKEIAVEGDYSNSAFLDAFNFFGDSVEVSGLDPESLQGDKIYKQLYEIYKYDEPEIDLSNCPDLGPVLIALASAIHGGSFTGTKRLAIKESDRGKAMKEELSKLGAELLVFGDDIIVNAMPLHTPSVPIDSHNDHRVVMAMTVLLSKLGGEIEGAEAVKKSWPEFFEVLKKLGLDVEFA